MADVPKMILVQDSKVMGSVEGKEIQSYLKFLSNEKSCASKSCDDKFCKPAEIEMKNCKDECCDDEACNDKFV